MDVKSVMAMVRNRMNRKEIYSRPEFWNAKAQQFSGNAVSMWPNNALNALYHREQSAVVCELCPDVAGQRILDIGCGTGRLSRLLAENGALVTGIDFSERTVEIANSLSSGDNPRFLVRSIFDLDEEKQYDIAFCWGVVTVACRDRQELADAIVRMQRSLKPGGRAIFLEPIHRGLLSRVLDLSLKDFLAVLDEANLEVNVVRQLHFWPARVSLAYFHRPAWIKVPLYHLGQTLMKLPGPSELGDYKANLAHKTN